MIRVNKFNHICQEIVQAINIDGYKITSTEEQTTKKLQDSPGIQLIAVYPSYTFEGDVDTYRVQHELLFFIVLRPAEGADYNTELDEYRQTQDAMIRLKEYLFGEDTDNFCKLFPHIDVHSVLIDPEYNIFGGYNGWSMKVSC